MTAETVTGFPDAGAAFSDISGAEWTRFWSRIWAYYDEEVRDPFGFPPSLDDSGSDQYFAGEDYQQWADAVEAQADVLNDELDEQVRDALIAALGRGLRQVVVVPLLGYSAQFGEHCLAVSPSVRGDADTYRAALNAFGR